MSGEGFISNVREVRQRVDAAVAARTAPTWDKRPGELEATEGLALAGAIGARTEGGWKVRLQLGGGWHLADLPIGEARALAAEILTLCDTLEHGVPE